MKPASPTALTAMLSRPYRYIRLEWNAELSALRLRTCVKPIQCYSLAAMAELRVLLNTITDDAARDAVAESTIVNFHHFTAMFESL